MHERGPVFLSTNYEKIILKFVVLSIVLARPGTILLVVREITGINLNKMMVIPM
jgi:hypothetical protein